MSRHAITPEAVDRFLAALADGSAPFIALAAERVGIPRNVIHSWLRTALSSPTELHERLRSETDRIRAEWMAETMKFLEGMTPPPADPVAAQYQAKVFAEVARQKQFLLTRLDRETFDIGRPAKNAPAGESDKPQVPTRESASEASKDLEAPPSVN